MTSLKDDEIRSATLTPIFESIPAPTVTAILATPPFVPVTGLINSRWLPSPVRQNYVLRSGTLELVAPEGKDTLVDLGIKTIFDLRSQRERTAGPDPQIDGVEAKWEPSTLDNETAVAVQRERQDSKTYSAVTMYLSMLETHKAAFTSVLAHVRDHPELPLLLHCTAGKDRTGVLAALLLSLAGADASTIDHDYALTRIGIEPAREFLLTKLFMGRPIDLDDPLVQAYAKISPDVMSATIGALEERYGSVEGYATDELGFTMDDITAIRTNLTT